MKSFQERLYDHYSQVLTINSVLHQSRTEFQEVLIFENRLFGKVLALDGVIQLTERDNHIYHEMIAHVPLLAHGSAERVLIIGGGDGGTLREVLKHPVRTVFLVELDREVIELSRSHLPGISEGAFEDRRATLIVRDATKYVRECRLKFDVIIIHSTDPVGPGARLFSEDFYRDCRGLLRRGGVIAVQSGAPFFQANELAKVCRRLSACFEAALPFLAPVPTYAGGMLALVAAGSSRGTLCPPIKVLRERFGTVRGEILYYTPEVHRASFILPPCFAVQGGEDKLLQSGSLARDRGPQQAI